MAEQVVDFEFDGNLREYVSIALPNFLLTIATLGLYRFWATTRIRRYLWSRTMFMGDRLEWSGTGLDLFRGALAALIVVFAPIWLANMGIRHLARHGHPYIAMGLSGAELLVFYALAGAAIMRALRYRLSRTHWRGIRGGSADPGLRYGLTYAWKNTLAMATLGIMLPWAMTSLWNQRWRAMSFGSWSFAAQGRARGLALPFLLCYLAPAAGIAVVVLLVRFGLILTWFGFEPRTPFEWVLIRLPAVLAFLFVFALLITAFYASFFRQMLGSMALDGMNFGFNAGALEWMELFLGDIFLVVATLGLGSMFLSWRHWTFYIRHAQVDGQLDIDGLTRSHTPAPSQGEGLLDGFDMGAL
jgi:uncharacterized membrane protein YjgN (DUF898 family)